MPVLLDEFAQGITAHRLTLIQIAIRRYDLDRDKLSERLGELVPKYLSAVPTAPSHGWVPTYYRDAEVVDPIGTSTGTAATTSPSTFTSTSQRSIMPSCVRSFPRTPGMMSPASFLL